MSAGEAPLATGVAEEVVWHDVECGAYGADLATWADLADRFGDPVLDLGCGTGRVALALARHGHDVTGVDESGALVGELARRAAAEGLEVAAVRADVRELRLGRAFGLAIAPMQVVQLLGGRTGRLVALGRVREHLRPGGRLAAAIVEGVPAAALGAGDPGEGVPDVREVGGWVYSSLPLGSSARDGVLEVRRLRQVVSPAGELTESRHGDLLDLLDAATLESEASEARLRPAGRLEVGAGDAHVASTVVVLEAP